MTQFTFVVARCGHTPTPHDSAMPHTFGSREEAYKWIESDPDVRWYTVMEMNYASIDESKPDGELYCYTSYIDSMDAYHRTDARDRKDF